MAAPILTPELFASLTKGTRVRVCFDGCMTGGTVDLIVGRKSRSEKYKVDNLVLDRIGDDGKPAKSSKAVQFVLRSRASGHVGLAYGNLGTVVKSFEILS